uniref:Chromatin assembly factor 1 subunit p150 C-terminal domain-containing protein n=1 Tax=Anopheles farauti TaxID=69004 RepID=A0A182QTZ9_9DIPT
MIALLTNEVAPSLVDLQRIQLFQQVTIMDTASVVLPLDGSKLSPGSSTRKLKQSRLPFQILSTAAKTVEEPTESRKRKPSTEGSELGHVAKAGRISEVKENVTSLPTADSGKTVGDGVINLSSDENTSSDAPANNSKHVVSKKTNKRKSHKAGAKTVESPKIFIKLPVGKRKRSASDKAKPSSKKKQIHTESLNMNTGISDSTVLDDSELSEDTGAEGTTGTKAKEIDKNESQPETITLQTNAEEKSSSKTIGNGAIDPASEDEASIIDQDQKSEEPQTSTLETAEKSTTLAQQPTNESNSSIKSEQSDKEDNNTEESISSEDDKGISSKPTSSSVAVSEKSDEPPEKVVLTSSEADSSDEDIYMLCTPNSKIVPTEAESKARKLTPKQIARRQEYERKRTLKQQEKQEKRRKLQEERDEKAREKEEQERQRKKEREQKEEQRRKEREEKEELKRKDREEKEEQKRKEREEKEEQKRKEREEKEKKRQAEMEQKNEEKRAKEEERRKKEEQREEERKRKEEEKEAEEKRKQKVSQAFTSFFVKKPMVGNGLKASDDENSVESVHGGSAIPGTALTQQRFMPFCVKGDMRLAPVIRRVLDPMQRNALEKIVENPGAGKHSTDCAQLYLELLRRDAHKPIKTGRTWIVEEEDEKDEIMIVDENVCHQIEEDPSKIKQTFRTKFFLFEENRRPPYRGTWRKVSTQIKARRPFAQDTKFFDYEVDSDDEWEEEEPGESLHGSDDEKDVDPEEEYEVDNEFFVPHGHLSDEELHAEEEGELEDNSSEAQKAKLKIMQQEFVAEMKKKTEKIKPRLIGCIWSNVISEDGSDQKRSECSAIILKMLNERAMLYNPDEPISFTRTAVTGTGGDHDAAETSPLNDNEKPVPKKVKITDDAVGDLARLVHGNVNNRKFLVREFSAFWSSNNDSVEFSLESIKTKIKDIANWGPCQLEGPMMGKLCWTVDETVLKHHDLTELTLPNGWKYHLEKNKPTKPEKRTTAAAKEDDTETALAASTAKIDGSSKEDKSSSAKAATNGTAAASPEVVGTITKFAKVLTNDERMKGLAVVENKHEQQSEPEAAKHEKPSSGKDKDTVKGAAATTAVAKAKNAGDGATKQKSKKRVQLLMSVPRGQAINQSTKNSLISQFLSKAGSKSVQSAERDASSADTASATGSTIIEID